jgi:hypothetical protein
MVLAGTSWGPAQTAWDTSRSSPYQRSPDASQAGDNTPPGSWTTGGKNHAGPDRPTPSHNYTIKGYEESNGGGRATRPSKLRIFHQAFSSMPAGAPSTLVTSFDGTATTAAPIKVHGEKDSMSIPDPNQFDGEVRAIDLGSMEWRALPPSAGYVNAARGISLLDFVWAGTEHGPRASGEIGLHTLEIMSALLNRRRSAGAGRPAGHRTDIERPRAVPFTPAEKWCTTPVARP